MAMAIDAGEYQNVWQYALTGITIT